jgi:hypothetical protein
MTPNQRRTFLQKEVQSQKQWIVMCGGDLAGYIAHYGAKDDPDKYGDGGEAIYAADYGHLVTLEKQLLDCEEGLKEKRSYHAHSGAVSKAINDLRTCNAEYGTEAGHSEADGILCDLIEKLLDGDTRVTEAFNSVEKWYA